MSSSDANVKKTPKSNIIVIMYEKEFYVFHPEVLVKQYRD